MTIYSLVILLSKFWTSQFHVRFCCFLTCIQVSQETGKVRWFGIPFSLRISQVIVIDTVKGFGVVKEADVFLEFPCFLYDTIHVGNLISGSSAFSKPSLYIWEFSFHISEAYLAWGILNITLLAWEMSTIVGYFEHSLALPFFEIEMKTDLFQSCVHCWIFPNFLACWVQHFNHIIF